MEQLADAAKFVLADENSEGRSIVVLGAKENTACAVGNIKRPTLIRALYCTYRMTRKFSVANPQGAATRLKAMFARLAVISQTSMKLWRRSQMGGTFRWSLPSETARPPRPGLITSKILQMHKQRLPIAPHRHQTSMIPATNP